MLTEMVIQKELMEPLLNFTSNMDWGKVGSSIASIFTTNAKGGIYSGPGISAYENQVVKSPTLFPFAKGIGLMGEAGPEIIMPAKPMADGNMGVRVQGLGGNSITVNNTVHVESSGNEEDDQSLANTIVDQLDSKMRDVLQDEMRPGGILNNSINRCVA